MSPLTVIVAVFAAALLMTYITYVDPNKGGPFPP